MAQLSNIHFFLILSFIYFIFKNRNKEKSFFILCIIIILYFINDSLRLLANNTYTDISIFVIKDLSLLLAIISILNLKLIKKYTSSLKNNKIFTIVLITYLIINFSLIDNKILYFGGFYDLFFFFDCILS